MQARNHASIFQKNLGSEKVDDKNEEANHNHKSGDLLASCKSSKEMMK